MGNFHAPRGTARGRGKGSWVCALKCAILLFVQQSQGSSPRPLPCSTAVQTDPAVGWPRPLQAAPPIWPSGSFMNFLQSRKVFSVLWGLSRLLLPLLLPLCTLWLYLVSFVKSLQCEIPKKKKHKKENVKIRAAGNIHKNQQQTLRRVEQCDDLKGPREEWGEGKLWISQVVEELKNSLRVACPCGLLHDVESLSKSVNPFLSFPNT